MTVGRGTAQQFIPIHAAFNEPGILVRITVTNGGQGDGTVTGAGLDCNVGAGGVTGVCEVDYVAADGPGSVDLTAAPATEPGHTFDGWEGDCAPQGQTCVLEWDSDDNVTRQATVVFNLPQGPPPPPPPPAIIAQDEVIVFDYDPDGAGSEDSDLFLVDQNGLSPLTTDPTAELETAWSPDGSQVAFRSRKHDPLGEIHIIDAAGTNERRLTTNPSYDHDPTWSPDGIKMLSVSFRAGNDETWTMNANGTGTPTNLTKTGVDEHSPVMSLTGPRSSSRTIKRPKRSGS